MPKVCKQCFDQFHANCKGDYCPVCVKFAQGDLMAKLKRSLEAAELGRLEAARAIRSRLLNLRIERVNDIEIHEGEL